jgi:ATP-dependent DNA helicase DinG
VTNAWAADWDEAIPAEDGYIDATFGHGGYLARRWGESYQPRDGQITLARAVDRAIVNRTHLLSEAPTGCHARGQPILMYDESIKLVEDVVVGDRLMGPDSEPRTVLGLARGEEPMFDVVPSSGERWRVNEGHNLTFVLQDGRSIVDAPLIRWQIWSDAVKREHRLFRVDVDPKRSGTKKKGTRYRPNYRGLKAYEFSIVPTGTVEPYFGFTLDGDGRFLLGDRTVTHNTGKSIAYSVPATYHAAMHGKIVVIVTANIALQEQLVQKDLPLLSEILPWGFSYGLLKGRSNYLCRAEYERVHLDKPQQSMFDAGVMTSPQDRDRLRLLQWAEAEVAGGGYGDQSTIGWKPSDKLWRELSVGPEDCRGSRCAFAGPCGALAAQKLARESKVVVTNYHIFFTNLLIYLDKGMDVVLPPFDVAIFDECHRAADVARDFFGWKLAEGSIKRACSFLRTLDPPLVESTLRAGSWFFNQMKALRYDRDRYKARVVPDRMNQEDTAATRSLLEQLGHVRERIARECVGLEAASARDQLAAAELAQGKVERLLGSVGSVLEGGADNEVIFLEEDEFRKVSVVCRLVRPAQVLREGLFGKTVLRDGPADGDEPVALPVSVIGTSATVTTESSFRFAQEELGVTDCETLVVDSPFDFERQALLIIPDGICDPNDLRFTEEVAALFLRTIELARGRTLGLFTSRKRMNEVFDAVVGRTPFRILRQDDGQRTAIVEEFRRDRHSVLLGVASFWAGVDVPGDSLSCVFIDKLPFPPPDDPVLDRLSETDKRAWAAYAVPRAIIEFKQGFGRLIRSATDRGVVVCCDGRLITKGYGKQFLRAMPKDMQKIRNLDAIREWLDGPVAAVEEIDPLS